MSNLKQSLRSFRKRVERAATSLSGGDQGVLSIERHGGLDVAFRKGTTDERVIRHSFENDIFYSAVPDYVPAPDHVIMDIGAHIGTFALLSATKAPKGSVWAIEASRDTFNYLRINAAINGLAHLRVTNAALSDKDGHARLYHDASGSWGHSIMSPLSSQGEDVETLSLATYMGRNGIGHVNFAKFNCEGAEFPILLTAPVAVLQRFDLMLILFHCDLAQGYTLAALTDVLSKAGFVLTIEENKKLRGRIIARRA